MKYTVVWGRPAEDHLAALWNDNPAIRKEISEAVNALEVVLGRAPHSMGELDPRVAGERIVVRPPVSMVYRVSEDDCQVRVIDIKLWDE